MSPGSVLALCTQLYGKTPPVYMLEIAGVSFELREGITTEGAENMGAAGDFLLELLREGSVDPLEKVAAIHQRS